MTLGEILRPWRKIRELLLYAINCLTVLRMLLITFRDKRLNKIKSGKIRCSW